MTKHQQRTQKHYELFFERAKFAFTAHPTLDRLIAVVRSFGNCEPFWPVGSEQWARERAFISEIANKYYLGKMGVDVADGADRSVISVMTAGGAKD